MDLLTGNANDADTRGSGWFIGFSDAAARFRPAARHGDFAAWGAGLFHRWQCVARATILTIRWNQP